MFNNKSQEIKELRTEIKKLYDDQRSFIEYSTRILETIQKNDKGRFMYELRQEDIELIEDGKTLRRVRKILN